MLNDPVVGPMLTDSNGNVLWKPLPAPLPALMPGRLVMQNDGNLVFFSRDNAPMWATNTGNPAGASSMLVLSGSAATSTLSLVVYDYSGGFISASLYAQS